MSDGFPMGNIRELFARQFDKEIDRLQAEALFDRALAEHEAKLLEEVRDSLTPPLGLELNRNGSEDRETAAYVAAFRDIHDTLGEAAAERRNKAARNGSLDTSE